MKPLHGLFLAVFTLVSAAPAQAQILDTDPSGFPLRQVAVNLTAGNTYEFSTGVVTGGVINPSLLSLPGSPGTGPDSVLSLRGVLFPGAFAGSDGCGANIGPSCFTFAVTTTSTYVLMLRAYRSTTPGQTRLWYRTTAPTVGPWIEATSGANISFGGDVRDITIPAGTTRVVYDTVMRPGLNTSHEIWRVQTNEWR